ncbi:VWA domain-containing protein [uncultured Nitrospira sp.]|uniref:nitric oxide reductase activation protein NorD n=1 Tax=uncultured Nitrospira sp. TaxID=157176 RepID=UPI0031400F54
MSSITPKDEFHELLVDRLDATTAHSLDEQLRDPRLRVPVLELLIELQEISSKIQSEAVWSLGELNRKGCLASVIPWLDLGITFAQASGALGLRYFKESPMILGFLEGESNRDELLAHVLELADGSNEAAPQCAYEWFKVLPQVCGEMAIPELQEWARLGMDLSEWNYVLGNEFFRECPSIARAVPLESAKSWIGFGMKLMVQNSFGKPDYIGTLEFFRTSPSLFLEFNDANVKQRVIDLGSRLADHSPEQAIVFLAKATEDLARVSTVEWKIRILQFGLLVADRDPEATLAYFARVSEVVGLACKEDDTGVFDAWFGQGMEALEYSVEAGRAFFGLETQQACSAVEQAMSGVSLRQVARSLKMFARALCGEDVAIEGIPEGGGGSVGASHMSASPASEKARVSTDGKTVYLPLVMRRSESREGNRRWYTVMVAHEVGHVEFGTYALSTQVLQRVATGVQIRYEKEALSQKRGVHTLGNLFQLYPQPEIIRDLWEIVEDARIDYLLRHEYPGLQEDLTSLTKEAMELRTLSHGMTAREIVLDALLLLYAGFTKEDFTRPGLQEVIDDIWQIARTILHPTATVDESVELADRLYQELERRIGTLAKDNQELEPFSNTSEVSDSGGQPEAAEHLEEAYQPLSNWGYRGILNPDHVKGGEEEEQASKGQTGGQQDQGAQMGGNAGGDSPSQLEHRSPHQPDPSQDPKKPNFGESPMQQWFQPTLRSGDGQQGARLREGEYLYEEWDGTVRDYRPQWCRVIEQAGREGSPDFVDETFQTYGPIVRLIRRYFEAIRPEAFRRMGRQSHGEDIDLDALVNWMVDRRQGNDSSDQVYATRQKRDRQVAVAFLVDMSGSTGRQIGARARPVIDIEKEGLLLLSEALSAIGDQYAMYGFSGQTRQSVEIHVLKDFDHRSGGRVGLKISGVTSKQQNRDGAAIRHATHRLKQQPAKVRLLILISDGKPLDDDYADEYSLEDTKMALREARLQGVHPFCITIDQAPTDYVKRMYGEIGYVVVDEVESLPMKLPKIYQRLTAR